MRGPIVLACLAAALFIGHATTKLMPPAEQPAAVAALKPATAPETAAPSPAPSVAPSVSPSVSWGLQPRPISTKAAFAYTRNQDRKSVV